MIFLVKAAFSFWRSQVSSLHLSSFILLVCASLASAQTPAPLESLVAPLLKAQAYCESGKFGARIPSDTRVPEWSYRVCARSDGRFKYVENPGQPHELVIWSDGESLHRFVEYGGGYQRLALSQRGVDHVYDRPREAAPALHSRLLRAATRSGAGLDLAGSLSGYRINNKLSNPLRTIYEIQAGDSHGAFRIHVVNGFIVRHESWYDGTLRGYVEITSREVNGPLSDSDISHEVPLLTRYSLSNNAPVFVSALFVITAVAGLAFWAWLFARAKDPENIARLRRRLWRYYAWALAVVTVVLGLLAVLTWGGSGHPPAIVYVLVMAIFAVCAFGLAACFLLMSYLARALARSRAVTNTGDD